MLDCIVSLQSRNRLITAFGFGCGCDPSRLRNKAALLIYTIALRTVNAKVKVREHARGVRSYRTQWLFSVALASTKCDTFLHCGSHGLCILLSITKTACNIWHVIPLSEKVGVYGSNVGVRKSDCRQQHPQHMAQPPWLVPIITSHE